MYSKLSKSSLRDTNNKKLKYCLIVFLGSITFLVLLSVFGFRFITQIDTNAKNQEALRTVINSLFTCPDSDWIQNFQNAEEIEEGNVKYTNVLYSEEYLEMLEEIYSPYFTEKMYQSFIPIYVNFNQASAYEINYQVAVDYIELVQDKKDPRSYTFTIDINYGPIDGNMKNTEVTGKAQCLEKGKISFLRFYENFYNELLNIMNRELVIENVITTIFNCPDQELIRLNEVMLEGLDQITTGDTYSLENSELYQKQDELYKSYFTEKGYEAFVRSTMPLRYHFDADTLGYRIVVDQVDILQSEQFETNYSFTIHLRYSHTDGEWMKYELEGSAQFEDPFSSISFLQIFEDEFYKMLWDREDITLE